MAENKTAQKEALENPRNSYPIELAMRRSGKARVVLTREEWRTLQRFLDTHEKVGLLPKDYAHLPAKVRLVVHDWVQS